MRAEIIAVENRKSHLAVDGKPVCKANIKSKIIYLPSVNEDDLCIKCLTRSYRFNLEFRRKTA